MNAINLESLYGVYDMYHMVGYKNGELMDEKAKSGMFVFTSDNRLAVVSGTSSRFMAYSGSFTLQDNALMISIESCSVKEAEGTIMKREIVSFDGEFLKLKATNADFENRVEITWRKKSP